MSAKSKEFRFHREVYNGNAVDAAVKAFEDHADFELSEDTDHWVVNVTPRDASALRTVLGEFANYALGLTIESEKV